jgi:hypothetical protein
MENNATENPKNEIIPGDTEAKSPAETINRDADNIVDKKEHAEPKVIEENGKEATEELDIEPETTKSLQSHRTKFYQ